MIERALKLINQIGRTFSFHELKKELNLTDGQLDIIKLQLLQLGFIKELKHHKGEDELDPITCRKCPKSNSCDERDPLAIKVYQLMPKAFDYKL